MKSFSIRSIATVSAASVAAFFAGSALATEPSGVDTSGVITAIEGAMTPIGAVATAVLVVLAGILVFRLIRRIM